MPYGNAGLTLGLLVKRTLPANFLKLDLTTAVAALVVISFTLSGAIFDTSFGPIFE